MLALIAILLVLSVLTGADLVEVGQTRELYVRKNEVLNCHQFTSCSDCSKNEECFYCQWNNTCFNYLEIGSNITCPTVGWCNGDQCTCGPFPNAGSIASMVIMMLLYGIILAYGAKMIADGSEDLLELFPNYSTVIGGLLLPILGAVPDSAMIFVSGAFGTTAEAQVQVAVGMGTLAGSTIMLLTIPWSASLLIARTDLDNYGRSIDGQCTSSLWTLRGWTQTGVTVDSDTAVNARIAIFTSFAFLLGQIVAFLYLSDENNPAAKALEGKVSLAGFVICTVLLFLYIFYQLAIPHLAEKRKQRADEEAKEKREMNHVLNVIRRLKEHASIPHVVEQNPEDQARHADSVAFNVGNIWKKKAQAVKEKETPAIDTPLINETSIAKVEEEGSDEEEESFGWTLFKSLGTACLGAVIVAFFSDPMVDIITNLGKQMDIGAFYISFIVTPFCSNASELIASLMFAANKTVQASSMTYSQLYGAATMNSTMGLAIFYGLIKFKELSWTFSAETMAILFATWAICSVCSFKTTFQPYWIFPNLAIYPLSLVLVYLLEHYANWQ